MDDLRHPSLGEVLVRIPPGTVIDGAVVELAQAGDGTVAAGVRINGPAAR